jgi:hypothetical protein
LKDPSCKPIDPQTVAIANGAGAQRFTIIASSNASAGKYTIRFTAYDPKFVNNSYFVEYPLYVVANSASLSIARGAFANQLLVFNTAAATAKDAISATSYSCPNIWTLPNGSTAGSMIDNSTNQHAVCSGPATSTTGAATSIQITIQTGPKTTAQDRPVTGALYAATLFGVPVLAILGWFGTRKSAQRNLFRFFGLVVLLVGFTCVTGCGGKGFVPPQPPTPSPTALAAGNYIVQVIAQGASGNKYYAEVPITVVQ